MSDDNNIRYLFAKKDSQAKVLGELLGNHLMDEVVKFINAHPNKMTEEVVYLCLQALSASFKETFIDPKKS